MRNWVGLSLVLVLAGLWSTPAHAASARVGLQAGHWQAASLPAELQRLRTSTGAFAAGYDEAQVNLDVAQRAGDYLRQAGVLVDILPATVPVQYQADAFVAIHADGNGSSRLSGYKIATFWREWEGSTTLAQALRPAFGRASGLRWDGAHISSGMRGYYAFSSGRFDHAIAATTPGVILEMGYLTNPSDRALMTRNADRLARGIADGVLDFLRSRPAGGWPAPPMPEYRAIVTVVSARIRSGPGVNFPVVRLAGRGRVLIADEVRDNWVKLIVFHGGQGERWIHRDAVRLERLANDPPQNP